MNLKIAIIPIVVLIIGIGIFSIFSSDEKVEISQDIEICNQKNLVN